MADLIPKVLEDDLTKKVNEDREIALRDAATVFAYLLTRMFNGTDAVKVEAIGRIEFEDGGVIENRQSYLMPGNAPMPKKAKKSPLKKRK